MKRTAGPRDADEQLHRPGDGDGQLFRLAQGERFRHQLAKQHVQIRDESKCDGDGAGMRIDLRMRNALQPRFEEHRDHRLADPAERQAAKGDAKLNRWQEIVEVRLQAADGAGSRLSLGDELLDAGLPHAHQRKFRSHEKSVGENQQRH